MSVVSFVGVARNTREVTKEQRDEAIALIRSVRATKANNVSLSDRGIVCSDNVFSREKYLNFVEKMRVFNHDQEGGVPMTYTVPFEPLLEEPTLDRSALEDRVAHLTRKKRFDVSTTIDRVLAACGEPLFGIFKRDDGWNLLQNRSVFLARCTEKGCSAGPEIFRVQLSHNETPHLVHANVGDVCGLPSTVVCSGRETAKALRAIEKCNAVLYNLAAAKEHFYPLSKGGFKSADDMLARLNAIILQSICTNYPDKLFVK